MISRLYGDDRELVSDGEGDMGARFKIRPKFVHPPRHCHPVLSVRREEYRTSVGEVGNGRPTRQLSLRR